ncbi:NUDIX domain-containing protein [Cyclonatronum proteinivorum]|uniref:NUDIX domain-containing protein n=1 Tax=Cyclonatronum proteinivorum TaxID=1457365 RepID=A0A345UM99_9BACT|nr:CoA pyrophosphatase [Cyclonatronum proteinivorum]AXJ01601.1 NUDIX domain-containing protein [Cyclonatronum proteinivorum]
MDDLESFLRDRLTRPLPGFAAQRRMGPVRHDGSFMHDIVPPEDCKRNAVMVVLYRDEESGAYRLILTERSPKMPSHAGEVSCPGGRMQAGESALEAAYRETEEEVGLHRSQLRYLGALSKLYIPVTNNLIFPHVTLTATPENLTPDPREVSRIFTPELSALTNPENLVKEVWTFGQTKMTVPYWKVTPTPLWGATAMILSELLDLLPAK